MASVPGGECSSGRYSPGEWGGGSLGRLDRGADTDGCYGHMQDGASFPALPVTPSLQQCKLETDGGEAGAHSGRRGLGPGQGIQCQILKAGATMAIILAMHSIQSVVRNRGPSQGTTTRSLHFSPGE